MEVGFIFYGLLSLQTLLINQTEVISNRNSVFQHLNPSFIAIFFDIIDIYLRIHINILSQINKNLP